MCQAYEGEARYVSSIEMRCGTFKAMMAGCDPLPDYCSTHGNYWCGCKPEQQELVVKQARRLRHLEFK